MTLNAPIGRLDVTQNVAFTATAGTSNPVGAQTRKLRIVCTAAAFVRIGSGAATVADVYFPPNVPEYVICNPGQTVSAIQSVGAGSLSLTEVV